MFGPAQKPIGSLETLSRDLRDDADARLGLERGQQSALAQARHAPALDQLRQLDDELDFPDAAFAELDVALPFEARAGKCLALPVLTNSLSQGAQRCECIEVEIFSVDERQPHAFKQSHVRVRVTVGERARGQGACLEPGVALPFASLCEQILLKSVQTPRQRARVAVGTQAKVGAEHLALAIGL